MTFDRPRRRNATDAFGPAEPRRARRAASLGVASLASILCFLFLATPTGLLHAKPATPVKGRAGFAPTPTTTGVDQETAELLRCWMTGRPLPPEPASTSNAVSASGASSASNARSKPGTASASLAGWRRFMTIQSGGGDPDSREKAFRSLYAGQRSSLLRARVLQAIELDPSFQSRQAEFIRQYGRYADGFNRVAYSFEYLVQGNASAFLQLGVDAVHGLTAPGEADAQDRLAHRKLEQALAAKPVASVAERRRLAALDEKVARAMAAEDLDRARWALTRGLTQAAVADARQAEQERPGWAKAKRLREQAEAAEAKAARDAVASTQVGYPDRDPPYRKPDAAWLRRVLAPDVVPRPISKDQKDQKDLKDAKNTKGTHDSRACDVPDPFMLALLDRLADARLTPPARGRATMFRGWQALAANYPKAPDAERRWIEATVASPLANPDARLDQALQGRRGQMLSFVLLGPQTARQHAYEVASWAAQCYQALQNVGIFYVFGVGARVAQCFLEPPVPESEYLDAQAAWLDLSARPPDAQALRVAQALADAMIDDARFEEARRLLGETGQLDVKRAQAIDRAEAQALVDQAEKTPAGKRRDALMERARRLAPKIASAARFKPVPKPQPRQWNLTWDLLKRWSGRPLPCGLPGQAAWFDGRVENGEAAPDGVLVEETTTTGTLRARYQVLWPGGRRQWFEGTVAIARLAPGARHWLDLSHAQNADADAQVKRMDRLPFPFAVEGGIGASGVDFSPRLKPIRSPDDASLDLYK
jgi:hypothetical protein